jgi:hypothetical protein
MVCDRTKTIKKIKMRDLNIKYWGLNLLNLLYEVKKEHRLMMGLMLLWSIVTHLFSSPEISTGINQSVPIMIVISLMTFLILLHLCWWLLDRFWQRVGLPGIGTMVLQYKEMVVWQQLGFYFLCFALLLLTGLGCLASVL